jgi:hypothetical protein
VLVTAPNSSSGDSERQPTISGLTAAEIALSDPLKAETRKARLYLLGVSMVGITIVYTGLVPQEVSTLGITFGEADRQSLLGILALVILYFLVAFAVYGVTDFLAWRYAYANVHWGELQAEAQRRTEEGLRAAEVADKEFEEARKEFEQEARREVEEARRESEKELQTAEESPELSSWPPRINVRKMKALRERDRGRQAARWAAVQRAAIGKKYSTLSPGVSWARALFEFLLPLVVGLYAIYALLTA